MNLIQDESIEVVRENPGQQLKRLRKSLGITQEVLADILCVTKLTIVRWENSTREIKGCALKLVNTLTRYNLWKKEIEG